MSSSIYSRNHNSYNSCNSCNCNCNCTPPTTTSVPKAIKNCCCSNSIKEALMAIQCVVNEMNSASFVVNLVVTIKTGVTFQIAIKNGVQNNFYVGNNILIFNNNQAISLCDIVKIQILTSQTTVPVFKDLLLEKLRKITTTCELAISIDDDYNSKYYPSKRCNCKNHQCGQKCDNNNNDCCCSDGVQNYLEDNKLNINTIGYSGSYQTINSLSAVTTITSTTVTKDIVTTTNTLPFVNTVTLSTTTSAAVQSIITIPVSVVTSIVALPTTLVSGINNTTTVVSGPVTIAPTTVVNSLTTATTTLISGVAPSFSSFNTNPAVTGYPTPGTAIGVVSGLTSATLLSTTGQQIPVITSAAGPLHVNIGGTNYPVLDAAGNAVTIGVPASVQVFSTPAQVLNVTGNPSLVTPITSLGAPNTTNAMTGFTNGATQVVTAVNPTTITGNLVGAVTTTIVNSVPTQPATATVINSVTTVNTSVQQIGSVNNATITNINTITPTTVLATAVLSNTFGSAVTNVSVVPMFASVINNVGASTITVLSPVTQTITGSIDSIGAGLMVVNETNGDISIYSICDIDSATTK